MPLERIQILNREAADQHVLAAAAHYEKYFHTQFELFGVFSKLSLRTLHLPLDETPPRSEVILAPDSDKSLITLTRVANLARPSVKDRNAYLYALLKTYRRFTSGPPENADTLTIAPKREGMILARALDWLHKNAQTPQMKRIFLREGLAVGVASFEVPKRQFRSCCIIDGAIASGATAMTIMELLCRTVERFDLFTVHATKEGIDGLLRYAQLLKKAVKINVGFISGRLNDKYYAVEPTSNRLVVGDLGDIISPIAER